MSELQEILRKLDKLNTIEAKVDATKSEVDKINNTLAEVDAKYEKLNSLVSHQQQIIEKLERESKKRNLIFTGIEEDLKINNEEDLEDKIIEVINSYFEFNISKKEIEVASRLGGKKDGYNRPITVSFFSKNIRDRILANKKKLHGSQVFINLDLSTSQQRERKELLKIRKEKKKEGKNVRLVGNKIIIEEITNKIRDNEKRPRNSKSSEDSPMKPPAKNRNTRQESKQSSIDNFFRAEGGGDPNA